jgi:hypothetical protein
MPSVVISKKKKHFATKLLSSLITDYFAHQYLSNETEFCTFAG